MLAHTALGFRAHSGWAALVAVSGPLRSPVVIDRRRLELVEPRDPRAKQPYHAAARLELKDAEKLVRHYIAKTRLVARTRLRAVMSELRKKGYEVKGCGVLQGSGRTLPALEKILASHPLLHTAEGVLFREVLARASEHCQISVTGIRERELFLEGEARLRIPADELRSRVAQMGKSIGPPWGQDEKYAALVAWLALAAQS